MLLSLAIAWALSGECCNDWQPVFLSRLGRAICQSRVSRRASTSARLYRRSSNLHARCRLQCIPIDDLGLVEIVGQKEFPRPSLRRTSCGGPGRQLVCRNSPLRRKSLAMLDESEASVRARLLSISSRPTLGRISLDISDRQEALKNLVILDCQRVINPWTRQLL